MSSTRSGVGIARRGLEFVAQNPTSSVRTAVHPSFVSNQGASTSQRYFSSSASDRATNRRDSAKTKRQLREKEDGKLRKAIDLYHLAGRFFPSRIVSSGDASSATVDGSSSKASASIDDVLDSVICAAIKPADSVYGHYDRIQQKTVTMKTAQAIYDAEASSMNQRNSWSMQQMYSGVESDMRGRDEARRYSDSLPDVSFPLGPPTAEQLDDLPPVDDREAVKAYIAKVARTQASDEAMSNRVVAESIDNRSARVRDALFGTVNGSHPGLEVVRERARSQAVQDVARQLQEEELERASRGKQAV